MPNVGLTIGEKLANYHRRHRSFLAPHHISEPLVRLLFLKQRMWNASKLLADCERPSWAYDVEFDHYCDCLDDYRNTVTTLWLARLAARHERAA